MSRRARFWRWYRTIPILAILAACALAFGARIAPGALMRGYLPVSYKEEIRGSSARYGVDPLLVCAIIKCESNWNEGAVSDAGAVGLMQLMPATSQELADWGVVDRWSYDPEALSDPATNIEYGCAYLAQLQAQLSSTDEVIAAYNAGPGSVAEWLSGGGEISEAITYPETALYLVRVKQVYERYQQLYDETLSER